MFRSKTSLSHIECAASLDQPNFQVTPALRSVSPENAVLDVLKLDPRLSSLGYRFIAPLESIFKEPLTSAAAYRERRIVHGIPEGRYEIPGNTLEYNMDALNGISFSKGCYVGQELIARTHFQGMIRKRLLPVTLHPSPSCTLPLLAHSSTEASISVVSDGMEIVLAPENAKVGRVVTSSGDKALGFLRLEAALDAHRSGTAIAPWSLLTSLFSLQSLPDTSSWPTHGPSASLPSSRRGGRGRGSSPSGCHLSADLVIQNATDAMGDASEPSSRRQNLEDELRRVRATVASLDTHIHDLKQELGWTPAMDGSHAPEAQAELWRTLLTRSPVAEAYRDYTASSTAAGATPAATGPTATAAATRGRSQQKSRGPRVRGRPAEASVPSRPSGAKRTRVLSNKEKRVEAIWSQCTSILTALKKHRYAWPFLQPVDAVALNIPDYYDVITHPMDLSTISKKLEHDPRKGRHRQYSSPLEFRDDVRLVWSNCKTYNKSGQDVYVMGATLSETWEKKWCQAEIEAKWRGRSEGQGEGDEEESEWLSASAPISSRKRAGRGSMSILEKRKLAQQISALNAEQLAVVSDLLHSLNVLEEEGEIVLDLESMDSQKLWIIKNKVDTIAAAKIKRTPIQP